MFTSYFANKMLKGMPNVISISRGYPRFFKGLKGQIDELKPTWEMVQNGYTYMDYKKYIKDVDLMKVYEDHKNDILCCYEKDRTNCHRGYLARIYKAKHKIIVDEFVGL